MLTLRTPRLRGPNDQKAQPIAYDRQDRYQLDPADAELVRIRRTGPLTTATLERLSENQITGFLVSGFFGTSP